METYFSPFGDSANLDASRCTVGAKRTMASETILDASDGTPRDMGHVEYRFGLFGDNISVSAR
jgi:hypothetical protein